MTILVTGGTGTLGRPTVERLRAAGHDVRVLSRTAGEGRLVRELSTGAGLAEAVQGAGTVLHLANGMGQEAAQTARLAATAREAGVRHLVYISIVGIERNPFAYYRAKLASETAVEESGVPFTILRATQFHDFIANLVKGQTRLPFAVIPAMRAQPIAVEEVAGRLVELAAGAPAGRVPDIAGPEQGELRGFAAQWYAEHRRPKRILGIRLPGAAFRAFREGAQLGTLPGYGTETFAEYAARAAARLG